MSKNWYKILVFGDRHARTNDLRLDEILFEIIEDSKNQLRFIVDLGDGINADCISNFDKSHDQLIGLQNEFDDDYNFRQKINKISPSSHKILLKCNHFTSRFEKLKSREYWMYDLVSMEQENLFRLKELGWELKNEWVWGKNKILFIHGNGLLGIGSQKNPVNEVRNLTKENNITIVKGHSHTTGLEVHRKFGKIFKSIQIGTLYDLRKSPSYIKSGNYLSNWTNSIGMFYCKSDGQKFFYTPIIFDDGETFFEGKHYKQEKRR